MRKISRRTICNNINNPHYIKRSILMSRFQREFIFPIRNARRKQVEGRFATTSTTLITSRGVYSGVDSKESSYSQ
jgi:hypothetical protein